MAELWRTYSMDISHELKTPLTSISGYAEILKDGNVDPETGKRFSEAIYREAQRMRSLIHDVLYQARMESDAPDTLEEVVYQYGQYVGTDTPAFRDELQPDAACTDAALRLLLGERILQPRVVFSGHAVQGKVHSVFRDMHYGSFYFCESNYPELYEETEDPSDS